MQTQAQNQEEMKAIHQACGYLPTHRTPPYITLPCYRSSSV